MNIEIKEVNQLPADIKDLAQAAQHEGLTLIDTLIDEYQSGKNRFSLSGEYLLMAYHEQKLIACGGLNLQWNDQQIENRIGRVRRFYVLPEYRKTGVGKQVLQYLEQKAREHFSALCLYTSTTSAVHFYQKMNYVYVDHHPNYNYFKYLT
ncbi:MULTISPECIES: GNAT family N-acetyltransferase [unclassified Acinetobacter]|uniref:GNAT family N-acetyltransferase n=1 Tax=unclassified Acinetobacter TaxID=196816 RepID=UPI0029342DDE|nr:MULTISPECIES: GNAT family N-acetyltransferase [unclassified Acinetobacter]WOE32123.1 GNAT family N-acetyltransferase [Acinetobacter sp. SAAs470]WOE37592.1 GNAT family N-acetyltransferase [Acinetobacter sp. SAAs474]